MILQPTTADEPLVDYPTGDGKPVGETPIHRDNLLGLIQVLRRHYTGRDDLYISGNMFMFYVRGDKRKHVSPDVFVTFDIPNRDRDAYFTWIEGKGPDVVFEFTSRTTRSEDLKKKFQLYERTLQVPEYFLFDPKQEYLKPSMRGYRLEHGVYSPIAFENSRLPSRVLGLDLERQGEVLRLYDPIRGAWVPTDEEAVETAEAWAAAVAADAEAKQRRLMETIERFDSEREEMRREIEALKRRLSEGNGR